MERTALETYTRAVATRGAVVMHVINEAHKRHPDKYKILCSVGAARFIDNYCRQNLGYMVLQTSEALPLKDFSVGQMYATMAAMARLHPNQQKALDAHAAAKGIKREVMTIANGHAVRREWAVAGMNLFLAAKALTVPVPAAATAQPLPKQKAPQPRSQ